MSTVNYEARGPIAIVAINRPEARNAVDRPAAAALAEAFRRFDATGAGRHGKFQPARHDGFVRRFSWRRADQNPRRCSKISPARLVRYGGFA